MNKRKWLSYMLRFSFVFLFCIQFLCIQAPYTLYASSTKETFAEERQRIYDDIDLLSEHEKNELELLFSSYVQKNKLETFVYIIDDLDHKDAEEYLEDIWDENDYGYGSTDDYVLMLINMEPGNREIQIQGYGNAQYKIDSSRCDAIFESIKSDMSNGNYFSALKDFIKQVDRYWNTTNSNSSTQPTQSQNDNTSKVASTLKNTMIHLVISAILGGIIVGAMAISAGGRMTANQATYLDQEHSRLLARRDRYIRTTITKRAKPKEPKKSSSSSSGGGVTKGGSSHSSGGGKF